VKLTNCYMIG